MRRMGVTMHGLADASTPCANESRWSPPPSARVAPRAHPKSLGAGDSAYVGWFLWMFRQIYAWTKRGAQGGERGFDKLAAAADSLRGVRASLVEMRLWTLDRGDYLARLDPDMAARLSDTHTRLVPTELLTATLTLLTEYERVCPLYCSKSGVAYPAERSPSSGGFWPISNSSAELDAQMITVRRLGDAAAAGI